MAMSVEVSVSLDEELGRRLEDYSDQVGCTPAEAIKTAVERLVADRTAPSSGTSLADRLRESGLIGSIQDGPGDLSTNPKHMEGFGE